jgi:hypothetical protein
MPKNPISRPITRVGDGSLVGWALYAEDYERAVTAMGDVIYEDVLTSGDAPANCARAALKAIGIEVPKTSLAASKVETRPATRCARRGTGRRADAVQPERRPPNNRPISTR